MEDTFAGKTTTAGVADADNITFTAVTGDVSEALVIYQHTGAETAFALLPLADFLSLLVRSITFFMHPPG